MPQTIMLPPVEKKTTSLYEGEDRTRRVKNLVDNVQDDDEVLV